MTNDARPTADDLLRHARQFHELTVLLKYDKDFERRFSAAVEAGEEGQLTSVLAPLGIEGASIAAEGERSVCERCWFWQGKWVCVPICK